MSGRPGKAMGKPARRSGPEKTVPTRQALRLQSLDEEFAFHQIREHAEIAHRVLTSILDEHSEGAMAVRRNCEPVPPPFDAEMRLSIWPSDLIRLFGSLVLWHPRVVAAIDHLSFESRPWLDANPGPPLDDWEKFKNLPETKRSRLLRDEQPNPNADIARKELKRIGSALVQSRGNSGPVLRVFRRLRTVLAFESLPASMKRGEKLKQVSRDQGGRSIGAIENDLHLAKKYFT